MTAPEERAREIIDAKLVESGWVVQSRDQINLAAGLGIAVREFPLIHGAGFADYMLFVDGNPVGVLEAKPEGHTLSGVEVQANKYTAGLAHDLKPPVTPLPFCYVSTGTETIFWNHLDPHPRSRRIFQFHRPKTLVEAIRAATLPEWVKDWRPTGDFYGPHDKPSSLLYRLQNMPPLRPGILYPNQIKAVKNLEQSLQDDRPRALIQMATGSGKTIMAITSVYRLIKYAGARRILFLVDRSNLGRQAETEFGNYYRTPDDNRKFTELYNVQRLTSNTIGSSSKVVISTIQRMYSMLKGEPEFDPALEEESLYSNEAALPKEPLPVVYNPAIPPEYFDVIIIDECHRSIYSLWRQVLEYFDAYLIGMTATPAKHTFGFFNQNLVMEYGHDEAVADGVNVDFEIYRIRTRITEEGATIEAGDGTMLGIRDRQTRNVRWESPDEPLTYGANELDRAVVAKDQIRTIIRTFRDKVTTEIFPGRKTVPKTLIFAKDDSHAEDIVEIIRQEFGKGNDFCRKITYKTTGAKPADLIQAFRNQFNPRIAVTVDMIATGTDIKPIEIVMFMRNVKSRVQFEQMKGRGVRIIDENELKGVTDDAMAKTHFVIVDCVGVTETDLADTQPLERKKNVSFKALLEHVALGGTDPDYISSLASRLARLDKQCGDKEREKIAAVSGGEGIRAISHAIVTALNPDEQIKKARQDNGLPADTDPAPEQVHTAATALLKKAVEPLATNPELRNLLIETKKSFEQIIDEVSKDELLFAEHSPEAREKARALVQSFERFLETHKDEITALQFFYSRPYGERLSYDDIKALHEAIGAPPRLLTPQRLWAAYRTLEENKVHGASSQRKLADIVSLIHFALHQEDELVPYAEQVQLRFERWMAMQQNLGREFTREQRRWLEMIRDHVAQSLEMTVGDFNLTPFVGVGGLGKAQQVFGTELKTLIDELNEVLVA